MLAATSAKVLSCTPNCVTIKQFLDKCKPFQTLWAVCYAFIFLPFQTKMTSGHVDSQVSIGFGTESTLLERVNNNLVLIERDDSLDNVCCLLLYCKAHARLAIKRMPKGLYLPYITYRSSESWRKVAQTLIKRLLERLGNENNCGRGRCSEAEMMDIFRVQWPKTRQFYTRITVLVMIEPEVAEGEKQKGNGGTSCYCRVCVSSIIWMGAEDLSASGNKFLGPEVSLFFSQLQEADIGKFQLTKNYVDCSVRDCFRRLLSQSAVPGQQNGSGELLHSAKYNKLAIVRLYNEFVGHCFPSQYMNFHSFKSFMAKLNLQGDELTRLFKAFSSKHSYLCFEELLLGLAALDTTTPHSGTALKFRLGFIFRYYDTNGTGKLKLADLSQLNNDIVAKNKDNEHFKSGEVAKMVSSFFSNAISRSPETYLDMEQFIAQVTANKTICQLTSIIFRSSSNILLVISIKFDYGSTSVYANKSVLASMALQARYNKACQICRGTRFTVLGEAILISLNGEVSRLINLQVEHQSESSSVLSRSVETPRDKIPFAMEIKRDDLYDLALIMVNKVTSLGKHFFSHNQQETLEEVTKLWYFSSGVQFQDAIMKILSAGRSRMQQESKIVAASSPCLVISGLYGNLKDLLVYAHLLWNTSPRINKFTYIFLGNLIGTQPHSLECLIYILCMKILTPHRFILLRGIQECPPGQTTDNAFYKQCVDRFANEDVWNLASEVFNFMPLGATIEEKIFCSSSGFPCTKQSLQSINSTMERNLSSPLKDACARDIL